MAHGTRKPITAKEKLIIAIIFGGGFITVLNQTVMSPALPSIMRDFGISPAIGQWLTSAFLLVNGLMIPITAFLIDRFSTRQIFMASMLAFSLGSVAAIFSSNFPLLLGARMLQAVGAGIQLPFVSVNMMRIFPKERRGFALGITGVVIGFAPAVGPAVAGWAVDQFGWRSIFVGMAPLGLLSIILAIALLKNIGEPQRLRLDIRSVALSTIGFGGILFGFSSAGSQGWLSFQTCGALLAGTAALILFVRRQLKFESPLLDLRVLKNPIFSTSTILSMVVSGGLTAGAVITPIYLQNVLGESALFTGMILMPGAVVMALLSPVSGALFDRFGPRALCLCGMAVITAGSLMLSFIGLNTHPAYLLIAYTFRMMGISLVNMPLNTWGINALPSNKIAHGNSVNNTARQVSGSIGTALLITVMTLVSQLHQSSGALGLAKGVNASFATAAAMTGAGLVFAIIRVGRIKRPHDE